VVDNCNGITGAAKICVVYLGHIMCKAENAGRKWALIRGPLAPEIHLLSPFYSVVSLLLILATRGSETSL
jgi:hypothetical protein